MTIWYQLRCKDCNSVDIDEEGKCRICGRKAKKFEFSGIDETSSLVRSVKKDFLSGKN